MTEPIAANATVAGFAGTTPLPVENTGSWHIYQLSLDEPVGI
ncbi:hypothetical protein ABN028_30295 [Actinopolymorpha sp. B17G11]